MSGPTPLDAPVPPGGSTWTGRAALPAQSAPVEAYWSPIEATSPYPPPRRRRHGLTAFVLIAGVFGLCCAGGAALAFVVHAGGKTAAIGSAPPGLNTPVQDGKFEFVVVSMSCGHATVNQGPLSKAAQGQYCLVELSVTNIARKSQTFADAFQKAIGPTGTIYGADTRAGVLANPTGTTVWTLINPGNKVSGTIVFDIPADAKIATVELHDSGFSHGVIVLVT
jgi:hypothetical protein